MNILDLIEDKSSALIRHRKEAKEEARKYVDSLLSKEVGELELLVASAYREGIPVTRIARAMTPPRSAPNRAKVYAILSKKNIAVKGGKKGEE